MIKYIPIKPLITPLTAYAIKIIIEKDLLLTNFISFCKSSGFSSDVAQELAKQLSENAALRSRTTALTFLICLEEEIVKVKKYLLIIATLK
jgi:hypothetical protein